VEIANPYGFYNKLQGYLDLCMSHAVTVEAACEAMRRPPAPASQAEATRWLQDPTAWHSNVHPAAFHVNVPYDGQLTYARLLHAAIEAHFPDALQLTAQAVMGVLRCSVEVLVQRHDGTVFRDAARIGRACADRAASKGATALAAELLFQLGRLHFEPVAPDPAYENNAHSLDLCMADRHDQQNWLYDEAPASQVDPVPERTRMLALAVEHFQEAMELASPELRRVIAGYLAFAEMEQASADPAAIGLAENLHIALATADQIPDDVDPTIGTRLRFYAFLRSGRRQTVRPAVLGSDFFELVARFGLSRVAAALVIGAPQDIPGPFRASWHEDYRSLADMRAMGERSRMAFQLRAGHCHPEDPTTCGDFTTGALTDISAVVGRFAAEPRALRCAALHWLHHQDYTGEGAEVVRSLVADGDFQDRRAFWTKRGELEKNSATREGSPWMSAVRCLAAADDLLRAEFPVWAQHDLSVAEADLRKVAEAGEDVELPPIVDLLERLIESGSSAAVRRKVTGIIGQVLSIAFTQECRMAERPGGVSASLFNAVFELAQLQKARWLTAEILDGGGTDIEDGSSLLQLGARMGAGHSLDAAADEDNFLDAVGWRLASSLTRYEAKPGGNAAEILLNLRKIYGLNLSRPKTSGAAPAVRYQDLQAALDSRSVALNLHFCWIPQPGGRSALGVLALAAARDRVMLNATTATVLPDGIAQEYLFRPTFRTDDGSLYELSPGGIYFARLIGRVLTDPLVREVAAEAAEALADAIEMLAGVKMLLEEASGEPGATHIMIWPSKAMYLLPHWLLPLGGGIVADRFLVTLLPTFQCLTRTQRPVAGNSVLAVGSSDGGTHHGLPPVPSLTTTALGIARAFGTEALVGRRANPAAVLSMLPHHKFVHISAHGYQDKSAPMFHCVYLNPADSADGRLYAHQIMGLDLSAVRLVTLNACEGNLLRFDEFDEISGLCAAFLHAGAAAVAGALWQIQPEVGEAFYATLYDCLADGTGTLTAFREAQLVTRHRYPEYRDWGAFCFVGTGDFREAATNR
jgi:hypothetical protein